MMKQMSRFLLFLATTTMTLVGSASDRFVLTDTLELEYVSEVQISPDGNQVVYVREFADVMTDLRHTNLWIVNSDGGGHRPLTSGKFNDHSPRWSPDGNRLTFISNREGESQIFVRWMDPGNLSRLTNLRQPPSSPQWSPDGSKISFVALVPQPMPKIANLPVPPEGAKWAPPARAFDKLVYRFDGAGFLKRGYHHLFIVPSEGGTPRQISSGDFQHGGPGLPGGSYSWSPDGRFLIAGVNRRPDYELEPLDSEVWEFAIADGAVRRLTNRRGPDSSPVVSPDGRWIAYLGFDDRYQGYQLTQLSVMDRDGNEPKVLSQGLDRSVGSPRWAADSSGVYGTYDDQGHTKLAFFPLVGEKADLTRNLGNGRSAYSGGGYSVARDKRVAIMYSRPDIPSDVAVASPSGQLKVLTAINDDLLSHKKIGEVEEIWYESSADQRKIQGWIIKPPDFDSSRKYPLILEIHGGPFANYGDRFDVEKQIWAGAGYVVLYTNPRGSTSYGAEFGNLIHHAYPGEDFYDLNSGVDAVIERGYIDSDRLYVTGGSGGGVLTAWMVGNTERFRAAVSVYPVINWYSWVLSADISSFGVKYWFPGLPWDHVEHYESRSLLSVVSKVKTPTMVLTGEEDYRTPMSESEQYYQALKLLDVESVLVRVPGESHGIRRSPSHHMQKIAYIQGWFDNHP